MAADLAIQSNQSSMLLRSLVDAGSSDLSYSMPTSYPLMSKEIREIRPKQGSTISLPNNQEVIWDLNKYQFLRDLMIRTQVTKTAGHDNPTGKMYGLCMYSEITLRSNNKIIQTLSDSSIRARVDNLPEPQKLAVMRRALMLVATTEASAAGVDATAGVTYTPIFSSFFDDVKNHLNLSFLEQLQVAARFNAAGTNGSNVIWDTATPTLLCWTYLPDLTYSNFLTAKNHKEGSILNMLCYNSQKQVFALDSVTSTEAKLTTNFPVFNLHYAIVSKIAIGDAAVNTIIAPIDTVELKFGGISVFGSLPSSVVTYEQEKTSTKLQLKNETDINRVVNSVSGANSYTGFATIPFGLDSVSNRKYNSGAVSFNNINTPTLSLAYPTVSTATNYQLEVVFEFFNMISISDLGIVSISASY